MNLDELRIVATAYELANDLILELNLGELIKFARRKRTEAITGLISAAGSSPQSAQQFQQTTNLIQTAQDSRLIRGFAETVLVQTFKIEQSNEVKEAAKVGEEWAHPLKECLAHLMMLKKGLDTAYESSGFLKLVESCDYIIELSLLLNSNALQMSAVRELSDALRWKPNQMEGVERLSVTIDGDFEPTPDDVSESSNAYRLVLEVFLKGVGLEPDDYKIAIEYVQSGSLTIAGIILLVKQGALASAAIVAGVEGARRFWHNYRHGEIKLLLARAEAENKVRGLENLSSDDIERYAGQIAKNAGPFDKGPLKVNGKTTESGSNYLPLPPKMLPPGSDAGSDGGMPKA